MELRVITSAGKEKEAIKVSDAVFAKKFNEDLVHQVITAYRAAGRSGTKAQKTRAEVSGGGIKPWRQKGTGRARAGTTRSPIWRKGGVTFAAKPRNFEQKVNKKMLKNAMRSIFGELARSERLVLIEDFKVSEPKTKNFAEQLKNCNVSDVLVVTEKLDDNLYLAARNLPTAAVCDVASLNPVALVAFNKVMLTLAAVKKLEEWLG